MESLRWIIAFLFGVPALLLISGNWLLLFGWGLAVRRGAQSGFSFALPLFGGVAGVIACLACPWPEIQRWWWLPLLLEPYVVMLSACSLLHVVARLIGRPSPFDR